MSASQAGKSNLSIEELLKRATPQQIEHYWRVKRTHEASAKYFFGLRDRQYLRYQGKIGESTVAIVGEYLQEYRSQHGRRHS